jgi:hypothetical protein
VLSACAPATIQGLKAQHAGKLAFEIDQNYQSVYRSIVTQARTCYQAGMITAQMIVQGDLYTDIRSGNVTVALHGGLGIDTYLTIDITAIGDNKTSVQTYYATDTWHNGAGAVERWVKNKSTEC